MHLRNFFLVPIHSLIPLRYPHRSTVRPPFSGEAKPMAGIEFRVFLNRVFMALFSCTFAFGGAIVGIIPGAMKGQTTETGLVRGAAVGAVTGALTALQLVDMMANGEPFSKAALIESLLSGKVFTEWVSPAVLKAYQWQAGATEISFTDIFDVEVNGSRGLTEDTINKLPKRVFKNPSKTTTLIDDESNETNCAICLQDFENNEEGRELPSCRHVFHLKCIDEWLVRQGSCPICRREV